MSDVAFYPMLAPTSAARPYIVYQRVVQTHLYTQRAAAGLAWAMFDFKMFASSTVSTAAISETLRLALQGMTTATWGSIQVKRVLLENEIDGWNTKGTGDQLGTGGDFDLLQTWRIWYKETIPDV